MLQATPGDLVYSWGLHAEQGRKLGMLSKEAANPVEAILWGEAPDQTDTSAHERERTEPLRTTVIDDARGWPLPCFWSSWRDDQWGDRALNVGWQLSYGIELQAPGARNPGRLARALPLAPLWPSFLANVALYAITLAGLIVLPVCMRRLLRVQRGNCPRCGYPVSASLSHACPECGWRTHDRVTLGGAE